MIAEAIIASVIAGSSVCSDHFENASRYMPAELSEYQQCVYTAYEKEVGTVGKNVWFQISGKFYYMQMEDIKDANHTEINVKIAETVLKSDFDARVAELQNQISVLESLNIDYKAQADELADIKAYIDSFEYDSAVHEGLSFDGSNDGGGVLLRRSSLSHSQYNSLSYENREGLYIVYGGNTLRYTLNGSSRNLYLTASVANLAKSIASAISDAYNIGYNDGYADGYANGYADGFADGVASVTN